MYDIATHALLSAAAKALRDNDAPAFTEEQLAAEEELGVNDTQYLDELDTVRRAIVLQLNWRMILSADPEFLIAKRVTRGGRTTEYRDAMDLISARAILLLESVGLWSNGTDAGDFITQRSVR